MRLELLRGPLVEKEAGSAKEGSWISRRRCLSEAATSRRRASQSPRCSGGGRLGGRSCRGSSWSLKPRLALKALHVHLKCETAAEEITRPLAMRRLNLRIGKDVLLLIEDTLEVAKQTFAIGGVVRLRGLMLSLPGCAQRGLSQN